MSLESITETITENKETRVNINMRVKESLKNKIKDTMEKDNKNADELFSDMFQSYLKEQALEKNEVDYSSDILELQSVIKRTTTIFQNMIEKTYMQNAITKDLYIRELENKEEELTTTYDVKLKKLEKERDKYKSEYELISEQATGLLEDTRELKDKFKSIELANIKNEELIITYKEQIASLKESNEKLKNENLNSINSSLLEKIKLDNEKNLLEKEKINQETIFKLQQQYNNLQQKYNELVLSNNIHNKK